MRRQRSFAAEHYPHPFDLCHSRSQHRHSFSQPKSKFDLGGRYPRPETESAFRS
jgi:hypothetical protein